MQVNEYIISFRGKASITQPLSLDREYQLHSRVQVTQAKDISRQDGTIDKVFVVEPVVSEITNDAGKKIEFKKKSTMSQALRWQIINWMRDHQDGLDVEDDELYSMFMGKLLDKFDGIATLIMKEDV